MRKITFINKYTENLLLSSTDADWQHSGRQHWKFQSGSKRNHQSSDQRVPQTRARGMDSGWQATRSQQIQALETHRNILQRRK